MPQRENNWIDGLRGIAALMVAVAHLVTAFYPEIHDPALSPDGPSLVLQLPVLRLCVGGPTALAMFFIISGHVSTSKILNLNKKDPELALKTLSRTTLARPIRLILPAAAATTVSWFLSEVGAYSMISKINAEWIRNGRKSPDATLYNATTRLVTACVKTWTEGWDEYDGTQWPMVLLLESSILCYVMLLATTYVAPRMRRVLFLAVYWYGWAGGQALKTCNTMFGMLLADHLSLHGPQSLSNLLPAPIPFLIVLAGAYLGSFPQNNPSWAPWSAKMHSMLFNIIPTETNHPHSLPIEQLYQIDLRRYWHSIGACLMIFGVASSSHMQKVLSHDFFNFLGRVSLPVYLLHNQLVKTVFTWTIYLPGTPDQLDLATGYLRPASSTRFWIATPLFFSMLYVLAWLWTCHIEPFCEKVTKKFLDSFIALS